MLGTTKTFKAYGKRKTNTVSKQSTSWLVDSPARAPSSSSESDSASATGSDSDADIFIQPSLPAKLGRTTTLAAVKAKRTGGQQSPNKHQLADKENGTAPESPRRPVFLKGRSRLVVQSPASNASKRATRARSSQSSSESLSVEERVRSPLKPKVYPRRATRAPRVLESGTEDSSDGELLVVEPFGPCASSRPTRSSKLSGPSIVVDGPRSDLEVDELDSDEPFDDSALPVAPHTASPSRTQHPFPCTLQPLLAQTLNSSPLDFTSFVTAPPAPFASTAGSAWRKIGEASYSEVFASVDEDGEDLVIKIIPISARSAEEAAEGADDDLPFMSEAASVLREIEMSEMVGGGDFPMAGFVKFRGAFVVQGSYPDALLDQWDLFKTTQNPPCDDQIRPNVLPADQTYAVMCLVHAGSDLENFKIKSWVEAASILSQVAKTCAEAECAIGFEHRDLHWGNILVEPVVIDATASLASKMATLSVGPARSASRSRDLYSSSVIVTLIDFTLSRAQVVGEDRVLFDAFEDECIFQGEGDQQFDIYRSMRDHLESDWSDYCPLTNLMWLHYLARKLLYAKKLKPPPISSASGPPTRSAPPSPLPPSRRTTSTARTRTLPTLLARKVDPRERAAYDALVVAELLLADAVQAAEDGVGKKSRRSQGKKVAKGRGRLPKKVAREDGWRSAGDFVSWWARETDSGVRAFDS